MMVNEEINPESPQHDSSVNEQQLKSCQDILVKLKRNTNASPFLEPVDPVKLNIPDYPEKIKHPMDLSTIKGKLDSKTYKNAEEFKADIKLMFNNCYTYNSKEVFVHKMGVELEKVFDSLYSKIVDNESDLQKKSKRRSETSLQTEKQKTFKKQKGMKKEDFDFCNGVVEELFKKKHRKITWPFLEPVDLKLVPDYTTVIKNPTDLATIKTKLEMKGYENVEDFKNELKLMVENCLTFNAPGTEIYNCGVEIRKLIDENVNDTKAIFSKIEELRGKIQEHQNEIKNLEKMLDKIRVYSLEERKKIGEKILTMSVKQMRQVFNIITKHVPDITHNVVGDEVSVDLQALSDTVMGEIDKYVKEADIEGESSNE